VGSEIKQFISEPCYFNQFFLPGSVEVDLTDLIASDGVDLPIRGSNSWRGSTTDHRLFYFFV
jgi:hypothetical protein